MPYFVAVTRVLPVRVRMFWRKVQAPGTPSFLPGTHRACVWPASLSGPHLMSRPPDPSTGRQLPYFPFSSSAPGTCRGQHGPACVGSQLPSWLLHAIVGLAEASGSQRPQPSSSRPPSGKIVYSILATSLRAWLLVAGEETI